MFLWDWLNGKKTYFGLLGIALTELATTFAELSKETLTGDASDWSKLIGYIVLVVGVLHRLVKGT